MPLSAEAASQALQKQAVPHALDRAAGRVRRLRGDAARGAATALLPALRPQGAGPLPSGDQVGAWLDGMDERMRRKVLRALHPTLGDLLARLWVTAIGDPHTNGWERRPFRSPNDPAASRMARTGTLRAILLACVDYDRPPAWFAAWAPYLHGHEAAVGRMLALAMDEGDAEVRDVLHATVAGDHEIGRIGRHVAAALLSSGDPADWEQVERLLLAAQRQEGLRQVILETVDLAHPEAFRRMLGLVREQELTRFAGVVRAAAVWFGIGFDVRDRALLDEVLTDTSTFLDDAAAREAALHGPDAGRVHLALWASAFRDAVATVPVAVALLQDAAPDARLAAGRLLLDTQLDAATRALLPHLGDEDPRLATLAHLAVSHNRSAVTAQELEPALTALLRRVAKPIDVDIGVLKPDTRRLDPRNTADLMVPLASAADVRQLDDLVDRMSQYGRHAYVKLLADSPDDHRDRLLAMLADRSNWVQDAAFEALRSARPPTPAEAPDLEDLLRRKSAGVRSGVIGLLLRQDDDAVVASIRRLRRGTSEQRGGGIELLRALLTAGRGGAGGHELATEVVGDREVAEGDRELVAGLAGLHPAETDGSDRDDRTAAATSPAGLPSAGIETLVDRAARTPAGRPSAGRPDLGPWRAGIERVLTSFDAWLAEHRDTEVTVTTYGGPQVMLVADLRFLPSPDPYAAWSAQVGNLPLPQLVDPWWERTVGGLTDGGLETLLAWPAIDVATSLTERSWTPRGWSVDSARRPRWYVSIANALAPVDVVTAMQYAPVVGGLLCWQVIRAARSSWIPPLLDLAQAALAAVPERASMQLPSVDALHRHKWNDPPLPDDWRPLAPTTHLTVAVGLEQLRPELFDAELRDRLWRLVRFVDEPLGIDGSARTSRGAHLPGRRGGSSLQADDHQAPRRPARLFAPAGLAIRAVEDGVAGRADLVDLLVTERWQHDRTLPSAIHAHAFERPLADLTRRRRQPLLDAHPWVAEVVDDLRDRIVATEAVRGDLPTPVSAAAMQLRSIHGAATVVQLLRTLGSQSLVRGWVYQATLGKPEVMSHLIRVCFPARTDTPDVFAALAEAAPLTEKRLLELAVYAPQWAPYVEHTLGWEGLTDGVHWLHAHTKDDQWQVDEDVRAEWAAVTHERTPLTAEELVRGHVDVPWFERTRAALGDERFDRLLKAARLASSSGGHKRAELFANALRGTLDRAALEERIEAKRHQDSVRALGLLPLPADGDERGTQVLTRYERLQDWKLRGSRFGQQRRTSEAAAVEVAMANLARTAGYRDPQRLTWAMEAAAVADLRSGPVTVTADDVTVTLSLTDEGTPSLHVERAGRSLKSVPKAVSKHEPIVALKERMKQLRGQARRMRTALEAAMVRGDAFTTPELAEMLAHPTLAPMLRALVFVTEEGQLGRPDTGGNALLDPDGEARLADGTRLRIAHATDLLASGRWHAWQRSVFDLAVRQPFKQVFRELYVPTDAERDGATRSERYAGHQLNPRQAAGLFGSRGWVVDRDEGVVRTFHDEGITVRVALLDGFLSPAEVADPTLETVTFYPVGSWEPLPIGSVPARLFSETMRDLDLVVSVAHSGGVDPETSASTVEMRGMLVHETAELLSLDNVELTGHHAVIRGSLGSYSVHLGSGTVHRRPGNAVCIVPVGAQHRGRLFLPFVDDDPRTAEVVSKVVLLARDDRIKDPTILEQLRA